MKYIPLREYFRANPRVKIIGIGVVAAGLLLGGLRYVVPQRPATPQAQLEVARQEGYNRGYTTGYNTAKEENLSAYQKGYETARKEMGRSIFTTYGITGFILGLIAGLAGIGLLMRKTLAERVNALRRKYELKKAFDRMPANLSPEVAATAAQIARAYANIHDQFRSAKGYTVERYVGRWRTQLKALMGKAVHLMDLIQELETARANVDAPKLDRTITDLQYTARRAKDDETRNTAITSLRRAKQTYNDLQQTTRHLEQCKTALQGITGVLDSMHLKISNIKVNTQKTELLDELSSELETEMNALEQALHEVQ